MTRRFAWCLKLKTRISLSRLSFLGQTEPPSASQARWVALELAPSVKPGASGSRDNSHAEKLSTRFASPVGCYVCEAFHLFRTLFSWAWANPLTIFPR